MKNLQCIVCGTGTYQTHVEYAPDNGQIDKLNNFGLVVPVAMAEWTILACDGCGNVQLFRPDLRTMTVEPKTNS